MSKKQNTCGSQDWTPTQGVLKKTRSRVVLIIACFILAYGVICFRLVDLTLRAPTKTAQTKPVQKLAAKKPVKKENADRASITDRNGNILATSLTTSSLYADPKIVLDPIDAAHKLSTVFPDLNTGKILSKLQSNGRFVWIKRNLTPKQKYDVNMLGLPGLNFRKEKRRVYPNGALTAHSVGYTSVDGDGLSGIENSFDELLKNQTQPLQLTLDTSVQHILHREIGKAMKEYNAIGGAGVVMNVNSGEILGLTSLPEFDPHSPMSTAMEHQFNRVTKGVYEMGSTFKIFSTAALLEHTNARLSDKFDARKPLKRAGFTIRDFHAKKRRMSVPEVLIHSSNIGSALMAEKIGTPKMIEFFTQLGLMDKADIELKEVGKPLLPSPWRDINTLTASYGHGMAVSPLQAAVAVSAIVNGGTVPTPTLIKRPDGTSDMYAQKRVVSEATSSKMRQMLRLVVADGTGSKADAKGYRVAGKTGTSEKIKNGKYDRKALLSSFVGVFPSEDPQYIVFIAIDEPKGTKKSYGYATGGWVAAPAVGNVIKDMAPIVGIKPAEDRTLAHARKSMRINTSKTSRKTSGGRRLASF